MREPEVDEEQARRWQRMDSLPRRALAWFTLTPAWPGEVAGGGFPLNGTSLSTGAPVLQKLNQEAEHGFLISLPSTTPWEGPIFSLPAATRRTARELFALDPRFGLDYLTAELASSAKAMQASAGTLLQYDPLLYRWARLAALAGDAAGLAKEFEAQVNAAFEAAAKADQFSVPEVARWIDAAQPIADIVSGPLLMAAGRATRRLELNHRRAFDQKKLAHYLPRPAQEQALAELLGDDRHWALHFAGEGGVGKTMLLRHITRMTGLAVSRVDFDYLNPDYPRRAPALLLVALAEEFRLQAGADGDAAFASFDRMVRSLNTQVESAPGASLDDANANALFQDVLLYFVDALKKLTFQDQPVLILDTCEELAKIRPDGSIPDNVSVTFRILKQLNALYPRVRVIFAGRRPLAREGFGWTADSPLDGQPHLRLHLIEHFTREEADRYLANYEEKIEGRILKVPEGYRGAARDLSLTESAGARSRFNIPGQPATNEARYNAYDLEMYADWLCRDDSLKPEELQDRGRHYYIRERIVVRAGTVRPLVPVLAVCGRFDARVLSAFVSRTMAGDSPDEATLGQRVRAVTDLDWIQPDGAAGPDMWRVDNPLRGRLLDYYASQESAAYQTARRMVGEVLSQETLSRPFGQLTEQYFEVALETLMDDPPAAASWWAAIEDRLAREGQWPWASRMLSLLAASPILAPDRAVSLRAAVQATRAAALLHTGEADPLSIWPDVEAALARYPDVPERKRIELRQRLATGKAEPSVASVEVGGDPQLVAACLAQVENAIEQAEQSARGFDLNLGRWLGDLAAAAPEGGMLPFVQSLQMRSGKLAQVEVREKWLTIISQRSAPISDVWLDWLPPEDLACRLGLEFMRSGWCRREDLWPPPSTASIDADRYRAALLVQFPELAGETPPNLEAAGKRSRANVHRYYPPQFVALAWQSARQGTPVDAIANLESHTPAFTSLPEVLLAIDRAILDIRLRYRLGAPDIPPAIRNSKAECDVVLAALYSNLFLDPVNLPPPWTAARIGQQRCYPAFEAAMRIAEMDYLNIAPAAAHAVDAAREARAAEDHIGELLAWVTEAVWATAAADSGRVAAALVEVKRVYAVVWEYLWVKLPEFKDFEDAAQTNRLSGLLRQFADDWQPLLLRAAIAIYYGRSHQSTAPHLLNWANRYAVATPFGQRFPREINFLQPSPRSAAATGWSKWLERIAGGVGVAFVLAVTGGLLWGGYRLLALGIHKTGYNISPLTALGLFFSVISLGIQAQKYAAELFSLYLRFFELQDEIIPEMPPNPSQPLAVSYTIRHRAKLLRFYFPGLRRRLRPAGEERYAWLNQAMGVDPWHPNYRRTRRLLLGTMADVRIAVDESTAGAPWEAIVQLPEHTSTLADSPLRTYRTLRTRGQRPEIAGPVSGNLKIALWSWAPETRAAGRSFIGMLRSEQKVRLTIPPSPDDTPADTDILVIYGNPVVLGLDVGIEPENVRRTTRAPSVNFIKKLDGSRSSVEGDLYRAGSIVLNCPQLRLCVVLPPPAPAGPRVSSDRRDAALMRRLGSDLFGTGIPAVLMLPAAVELVSQNVLGKLRPVFGGDLGPRNTARALIAAVNDIQRALAALSLPDQEAALEIALDACLYCEETVDLRVAQATANR